MIQRERGGESLTDERRAGKSVTPRRSANEPSAVVTAAAVAGSWTVGGKTTRLSPPDSVPFSTDPESLAEIFPGRWNARRRLPDGIGPLVEAFSRATMEAGWWSPRQKEWVNGGLVFGTDYQSLGVAWSYARELARAGAAGISPSGFLFSLPSAAAAVVGILFGLRDFQATLTAGGNSGFQALSHAIDMLTLKRADRLVVAALTVVTPEIAAALEYFGSAPAVPRSDGMELAAALCLERGDSVAGRHRVSVATENPSGEPPMARATDAERCRGAAKTSELTSASLADLPIAFQSLAAPSLLALIRLGDRILNDGDAGSGPKRVFHAESTDRPVAALWIGREEKKCGVRSGELKSDEWTPGGGSRL